MVHTSKDHLMMLCEGPRVLPAGRSHTSRPLALPSAAHSLAHTGAARACRPRAEQQLCLEEMRPYMRIMFLNAAT